MHQGAKESDHWKKSRCRATLRELKTLLHGSVIKLFLPPKFDKYSTHCKTALTLRKFKTDVGSERISFYLYLRKYLKGDAKKRAQMFYFLQPKIFLLEQICSWKGQNKGFQGLNFAIVQFSTSSTFWDMAGNVTYFIVPFLCFCEKLQNYYIKWLNKQIQP